LTSNTKPEGLLMSSFSATYTLQALAGSRPLHQSINHINHTLLRKIHCKKQQQNHIRQTAKKSEDHHSWLPLVININVIQKHKKRHKKKNNDVQCNKSTSARLSKFQFKV